MDEFTVASTRAALNAAADLAGLDAADAQLLRLGENAVFRLPGTGVVARVARSAERLGVAWREIRVARWLDSRGVPAVQAAVQEPIVADERVVTFWEEIPDPRPATPKELGVALRALHGLRPVAEVKLSEVRPLARVRERIRGAGALNVEQRGYLLRLADSLEEEFAHGRFELPTGVVHGDGHVDNLVRGSDGRLAFIDLEECALGHPEWDLVLTAIELDCGWISEAGYREFADAYGYDVVRSPAYTLLRRVRMLRMTSWLAQKAGESAETAAEVGHRIETLRTNARSLGWRAY